MLLNENEIKQKQQHFTLLHHLKKNGVKIPNKW